MTFSYAQLSASSVCIGVSSHPEPLPESPLRVLLAEYDAALIGQRYESATGGWIVVSSAPSAPALRRLSLWGFRRRFTKSERSAIEWAAVDRADQSMEQRQLSAELRATLADQAAASFIDLDDVDTVDGVHGLETLGLLAAGRADEILGAPVTEGERV